MLIISDGQNRLAREKRVSKNATSLFSINNCHCGADTRLLLRLILFKTDRFDVTSGYDIPANNYRDP